MEESLHSFGYFSASIHLETRGGILLRSNNERAFIIAQLQDLLSPRLLLGEIPAHQQLGSCIDLLAFSIQPTEIQLVFFSIDGAIATYFTRCIAQRLEQYKSEYAPRSKKARQQVPMRQYILPLTGPHHALEKTLELHLHHRDWEYDRYSSIGFYLHDRRGDWMRTWRIAQLYENSSDQYLSMIQHHIRRLHQSTDARFMTA